MDLQSKMATTTGQRSNMSLLENDFKIYFSETTGIFLEWTFRKFYSDLKFKIWSSSKLLAICGYVNLTQPSVIKFVRQKER